MDTTQPKSKPKQQKGFAVMSKAKQRAIASKGGRAAHEKGTAYEWDGASAKAAGKKGGHMSRGGRGKLPPGTDGTPNGSAAPA